MTDLIYWRNFCFTYDIKYLNKISEKGRDIIRKYLNSSVKFKGLQRILQLYQSLI